MPDYARADGQGKGKHPRGCFRPPLLQGPERQRHGPETHHQKELIKEIKMKKVILIVSSVLVLVAAALVYYFVFMKNLQDRIVIPYISHQKPRIDPHVPGAVPLASKLDEVLFDGLFNVSANKSGITY